MARAYPYRTPCVDSDSEQVGTATPRMGLGIVPYGAIAAGAGAAGVLKPKLAKSAGAVASAATGAKVGSAFGPIGTAIGAVLGAAAGLLGGKKVAISEQAWDAYKPIGGSQPGRAWPAREWELAFEGMWKTNNKRLAGVHKTYPTREPFKQWIVTAIAKDYLAGKINGDMSAAQIAEISVFPEMDRLGAQSIRTVPPMKNMFIDLVDRIITAQPFTRAQVPNMGGGNMPKIATLSEVLERLAPTPAPAASAPSDTTVKAAPPPAVPVPATSVPPSVAPPALPAPAQGTDVASAVRQITDALLATQAGQALTQQQATNAAAATALQWLQSQGVPTSPAVQAAVTDTAAAQVQSQSSSNWIPWGLGAAVLIGAAVLSRRDRRRS